MENELIEALKMYEKHGWTPGRVLFSDSGEETLRAIMPTSVEFVPADLNAVWFWRNGPRGTTWEIRRLGGSPYALCVTVDKDSSVEALNQFFAEFEKRLAKKPSNST